MSGWRAADLRRVCPDLVKRNIEYGLMHLASRRRAKLLYDTGPSLRAVTGIGYGRIWDHEVVRMLQDFGLDDRWTDLGETKRRSAGATGFYASDQDLYIFLVDREGPILIPKVGGRTERFYRGFYVSNSEVGRSSLILATFLYRSICKNRMVMGMAGLHRLSIHHTKRAPKRFATLARKWLSGLAESPDSRWRAQTAEWVGRAIHQSVGEDDNSVIMWLYRRGFSLKIARAIIAAAKKHEGQARTVWDLVQGGTVYARGIKESDMRVALETKLSGLAA
jgi:hypothetical protein